jgi:hypothetical protein
MGIFEVFVVLFLLHLRTLFGSQVQLLNGIFDAFFLFVVCFSLLLSSLHILDINHSCQMCSLQKILSYPQTASSHDWLCVCVYIYIYISCSFIKSHLPIVGLNCWVKNEESPFLHLYHVGYLCASSFRFYIYVFDLGLVHSERHRLNFILLHVDIQFSQKYLFKILYFLF